VSGFRVAGCPGDLFPFPAAGLAPELELFHRLWDFHHRYYSDQL